MKLNEILDNEDKVLTPIIAKIKKDCGPFLTQSRDKPLMRGFATSTKFPTPPDLFTTWNIRMDRAPRDSGNHPFFNWTYNAVIEEKFKIHLVRSTSEYCTGNPATAEYYGHALFIFPIGKFNFLWSEDISDSFEDIPSLRKHYINYQKFTNGPVLDFDKWKVEVVDPLVRTWIEKDDYNLENLKTCADPILNEIYDWVHEDYEGFKRSDLDDAIRTGKEISIQGPGGYHAISTDKLERLLNFQGNLKQLYKDLLKKF